MSLEIEVKFAVADFEPIREVISRLGGALVSRLFEENLVLDTEEGDLRRQGVLLRLRRDGPSTVTLKIPPDAPEPAGLKVRHEIETAVADQDAMEAIFARLGFLPALRYEKVRETWRLYGALVCLDLLPFGPFVEIEGDPAAIEEAAEALGLPLADGLSVTYHDLYQEHLISRGLPPADSFVFTEEERRRLLAAMAKAEDLPG